MKTLNLFILASVLALFASCDSTDSITDTQNHNLDKIVIVRSNDGQIYNKNILHFVNNEVTSDSIFDSDNNFMYRNVTTIVGLTKTYLSYMNTGELRYHQEEYYDLQGRIIGRHNFDPMPSALYFTYVYNSDGTVTSKAFNEIDNTTTVFRTFTKNTDGIIYKENGSFYNTSTNQTEDYEITGTIQNQKLLSTTYTGSTTFTTVFDYYPNPKPTDILKSVDELNNEIILGNEMRYLAENGNYYIKQFDNISTFDTDNYQTYYKSEYTSTTSTPAVVHTYEKFYYYN